MKYDCIIWASDYSKNSGEGVLANIFIDQLFKYNKKFNKLKKKTKFISRLRVKKNFLHKYFDPIYGAFNLLLHRDKEIVYINYLPLWNFFIFILLPKRTVLGPITGGVYNGDVSNLNFFIRKYIFPFLYKISLFIIFKKFDKVIFSTDILKNFIPKKKLKKSVFNFILLNIKYPIFKKKYKKKFEIIIYNRNHETKKNINYNNFLLKLINEKKKICIVGDKLKIKMNNNCTFFGYIPRNKLFELLQKCKFAINSLENYYSLFATDAFNNNCVIISEKNNNINQVIRNSKNFIQIDYNNLTNENYNLILKNSFFKENDNLFLSKIKKNNNKIFKFIRNY